MGCTYTDKKYQDRLDNVNRIHKLWNSFDSIKKSIGESTTNLGNEAIDIMSQNLFQGRSMTVDSQFTPKELKRMEIEIKDLDGRIRKKNLGAVRLNGYVGEALSGMHPLARSFYETIGYSTNFERNKQDKAFYQIKGISESMLAAYTDVGGKDFRARLRNLQAKYFKHSAKKQKPGDGADKAMFEIGSEIDKIVQTSAGGEMLTQYKDLVAMSKKDFGVASSGRNYNRNVISAASSTRDLLNHLGERVVLPGLDNLYQVAVRKVHNGEVPALPDKSLITFKKKIQAAKDRVLHAIKKGGYYPHIMLEDLYTINNQMQTNLLTSKNGVEAASSVMKLSDTIDTLMPDRLKAKSALGEQRWSSDPIEVLQSYSKDVIAFNKINNIANAYLKVLPGIHNTKIDSKFLDGMHQFINDQFAVSSRGMKDRPDWVNNMSHTLLTAFTLKTMGFSTTGAARNTLSAAYFFAGNGGYNTARALVQYKANKKFGGDVEGVKDILNKVEQEQGFHFTQKETFNALVSDGIVTATADKSSIQLDPIKNQIIYKDKGKWRHIDDAARYLTSLSLMGHRFGENITRQALFRQAFTRSYELLSSKTDMSQSERQRRATNFGLRLVNQFAFEYAPNAKARFVGGRAGSGKYNPETKKYDMTAKDYAAAGGQLAFQFMHFPMSFLQAQTKMIRGSVNGMRAGQINSPETYQILNFAGVGLMTGALSIALDRDFYNILTHDTSMKFKNIYNHLTDDPDMEGKKHGIAQEFLGPIPGEIMFWAAMADLGGSPSGREGMTEMLLGDNELPDTSDKFKLIRERLSVEWQRLENKYWPALRDGHGDQILWHFLAAYPRDWTRDMNYKIRRMLGVAHPKSHNKKDTRKRRVSKKLMELSKDIRSGRY